MDSESKEVQSIVEAQPEQENIDSILKDPNVEFIYANGFTVFVGNSDVGIILKTNNFPHKVLNISYTLAKTLMVKIQQMLSDLEDSTNNEIMTTDTINERFLFRKKNK